MKLKEYPTLLVYSFKQIFVTMYENLKMFKHPSTWSTIFWVMLMYGLYTRDTNLLKAALPLILLVFIIQQKIDGGFRQQKFRKDLRSGKHSDTVYEYYNKYRKQQKIIGKDPLDYHDWIVERKIDVARKDHQQELEKEIEKIKRSSSFS